MSWRWIDRLFRMEEINGAERCPTYLYRWTLLKFGSCGLYLHHFVGDDWSLDLHDHPKRFVSIGLWERYRETTPFCCTDNPSCKVQIQRHHVWRAPWIRTFPAEHIHRISMIDGGDCWTLVIVLRNVRKWGFWHLGEFIPWRKYVDSQIATDRKACP
jgi:hypothetical protein